MSYVFITFIYACLMSLLPLYILVSCLYYLYIYLSYVFITFIYACLMSLLPLYILVSCLYYHYIYLFYVVIYAYLNFKITYQKDLLYNFRREKLFLFLLISLLFNFDCFNEKQTFTWKLSSFESLTTK